ncbi:Lrp/AsnC family transcriptional regulator [Marinomonas sp. UCMA 3892]|jgi:Lrp/AsnC family transcriptional regulator, leucine-responsive regulatory protein|uniref:Putative transcriptional regulator, AsnC family n=1 Tax=Marinomonas sp. (strain MWYL1) TaxID=400668 RepID=A6VWW8_MARMS|nr:MULTISPECIES: Lrp/AsnC family transcriptional regulator [unclassified Marinomonas]NLU99678.1 Lrp/AsnC family transcriptional regulator [Marinomonas sp. UCMA 3892]QUX91649.1 Lrp/AsnC family transcriptional regulator [Marinomonas sp. A3A]
MGFDKIDLNILRELQQDSSLTNQELADRVGLSASPCLRRVKALEENGVIDRKVTILKKSSLGLKLTAFLQISMDRHTPDRFSVFEDQVDVFPEVRNCNLVTGQNCDYLLEVVVEDMEKYHDFLLGKLTRIPGVTGVQSSFLLRSVKESTSLPLDHLI